MSKIRKVAMFIISTIALCISVISSLLIEISDSIMFDMMVSEKLCIRCSKKFEKITSENPVCEHCASEIELENQECEDECIHPHSPMQPDHMHAYR